MKRLIVCVVACAVGLAVYRFVEPAAAPLVPDVLPIPDEDFNPTERHAVMLENKVADLVTGNAPWIAPNNAAVALLEAGDVDAAIAGFEDARVLAGDDPRAAVVDSNLAEALTRRGRAEASAEQWDRAIADLERAVELDQSRTDVAALLERLRSERAVEADFSSYSSLRFRLVFDGDRAAILNGAQRAIDVLETAYGEYWLYFGHDILEPGERIDVVLYSPEQFHELTGLGHWAGGAYDGRVRVPVVDFDGDESRWTNTLWHELVHAFLHDLAPRGLPGWLDEGLAQWFEPGSRAAVVAARASLTAASLHPLSALNGTLASLGDPAAIRRAYAQSLAFTSYLEEQYGDYVVRELVTGVGRGVNVATRFLELVGISLEQAQRDFAEGL